VSGPDAGLPRGTVVLPPIVQVHFDGACQPPQGGGVATYGFVVEGGGFAYRERGLAVRPWSPTATNNVAEYVAAIRALEWLLGQAHRGPVIACGDSQLVIRQMSGEYKVRAAHLRAYWEQLQRLAGRFEEVRFVWVPREENVEADRLSKEALEEAAPAAHRIRPRELPTPAPEDGGEPGADPSNSSGP
jgi:ribonuclease HI